MHVRSRERWRDWRTVWCKPPQLLSVLYCFKPDNLPHRPVGETLRQAACQQPGSSRTLWWASMLQLNYEQVFGKTWDTCWGWRTWRWGVLKTDIWCIQLKCRSSAKSVVTRTHQQRGGEPVSWQTFFQRNISLPRSGRLFTIFLHRVLNKGCSSPKGRSWPVLISLWPTASFYSFIPFDCFLSVVLCWLWSSVHFIIWVPEFTFHCISLTISYKPAGDCFHRILAMIGR